MTRKSFTPGELWPDTSGTHINAHGGGILFEGDTYYWFGEHKIVGKAGNSAQVGVHVYASTDLYNWTDRGIALSVLSDPKSPIAKGCILERPKVVWHPSARSYVMWFHLEPLGQGYTGALVGVATAGSVSGPYQFIRAFRPNAGQWPANTSQDQRIALTDEQARFIALIKLSGAPNEKFPPDLIYRRDFPGGQMSRDQTLFIDPWDGAAYHFCASEDNGTLHISRLLDSDWQDSSGVYTRNFPGRFHEAPSPFFARGKYWLFSSGCTGWAPNAARLSVADSPLGPWRELGNPCRGTSEQMETTFQSQSTFVIPVAGRDDAFIFMADRWTPDDAIDGRYVWLPVRFDANGVPYLEWLDEWSLDVFDRSGGMLSAVAK